MLEEPEDSDLGSVEAKDAADRGASPRLIYATILGVAFLAFSLLFGFLLLANIGTIGDALLQLPGPVLAGIPLLALLIYIAFFA